MFGRHGWWGPTRRHASRTSGVRSRPGITRARTGSIEVDTSIDGLRSREYGLAQTPVAFERVRVRFAPTPIEDDLTMLKVNRSAQWFDRIACKVDQVLAASAPTASESARVHHGLVQVARGRDRIPGELNRLPKCPDCVPSELNRVTTGLAGSSSRFAQSGEGMVRTVVRFDAVATGPDRVASGFDPTPSEVAQGADGLDRVPTGSD